MGADVICSFNVAESFGHFILPNAKTVAQQDTNLVAFIISSISLHVVLNILKDPLLTNIKKSAECIFRHSCIYKFS